MVNVLGLLGSLKKYREIITVVVITVIGIMWTQKPFMDRMGTTDALEAKIRSEMFQAEKRSMQFAKDRADNLEKQMIDKHVEVIRGLDRVDKSIHDLSLLIIRAYKEKALSGVSQGERSVN